MQAGNAGALWRQTHDPSVTQTQVAFTWLDTEVRYTSEMQEHGCANTEVHINGYTASAYLPRIDKDELVHTCMAIYERVDTLRYTEMHLDVIPGPMIDT